jgi:hydroxyethylthiazole kinase-like sugar kinase family protein
MALPSQCADGTEASKLTAGHPCMVWIVGVDGGMGGILGSFVATRNPKPQSLCPLYLCCT